MTALQPLHGGVAGPPALLAVVAAAAVGAGLLLGVALAAYARRGSRPYLLVVGAFLALFGRSAVAALTMAGALSPSGHHLLEHGLDVVLVALVVAAVYHARSVSPEVSRP
ncbi:MAG: hypothetical protein ABEJ61_02615 [Haloferacaceae archaeon]